MRDEPDPPRKVYALKPKEGFARANAPTGQPSTGPLGPVPAEAARAPGPAPEAAGPREPPLTGDFIQVNVPASLPSDQPTSVHELLDLANGDLKPLGEPKPAAKPNEVHELLRQTIERDKAAGLYDVTPGVDTRKVRRRYTFWYPLLTLDLLLEAMVLWHIHDIGLGTIIAVFVGAVINGAMIWSVWVLGN
jgi:hypothetical protein